ncbi:MAG: hypothetical protein J7K61_03090 [Thermoplasmata archaeon]|nr:hypothetical protein [Thermoplasmata archaeon]
MAITTFAEEIYLCALTGRVVGEHLLAGYDKIAVIGMKNILCSSMAAAIEASYVSKSGGRAWHFVAEKGDEEKLARELAEYDAEAIAMMFTGESDIEETKEIFINVLKEMAEGDIIADIIIHARIYASGILMEAIEDEKIHAFLRERNIYVYTISLDDGFILVNEADFDEGLELHRLAEIPVTVEHAILLNKSLKNRMIKWEEVK